MKILLDQLIACFNFLNLNRIYAFPDQNDTKEMLAKLGAIFKASGDYDEFYKYRQHLYSVIEDRKTRKHAVQQLENMIREKIELWKYGSIISPIKPSSNYINQEIIEGFINKKDGFNYTKLVNMLRELNFNIAIRNPYSAKALIRGILDHIPPLIGCITFNEVTYSYSWGESEKKYVRQLLDFKDEAHSVLHAQISDKKDLVTIDDIPPRIKLNTLLQECLNKGVPFDKSKIVKLRKTKTSQRLQVEILNKEVNWANHACDFPSMVWASFKLALKIDNYKSNLTDYVFVALRAKGNDSNNGMFNFTNFVFGGTNKDNEFRPNEPFEIGANKVKQVVVFISDTAVGTSGQRQMPDVDIDTLQLIVSAQSGQVITNLIPPGWITRG